MAMNEYFGEDMTAHVNEGSTNKDFEATVYDSDDTSFGTDKVNEEAEKQRERKQKIKSDTFSLAASAIINLLPMVIDTVKHRKDPTPYKQNKSDIVRFGISMILPTIQFVDTVALNGKIQDTIKTKTPFTLGDIRNVVNVVQAYPSTHKVIKDYFSNVSRQANGQQQIITDDYSKRNMFINLANTVSPYIMDKMADDRYTMLERLSSIIPIKMFGGLVRKFASTDPKLQHGYDLVTTCIKVADYSNKSFNTAIRSNNGMRTGPANSFGTVIDVLQDVAGMSRGNISRYNDGGYYDGWNGGSRFNNF